MTVSPAQQPQPLLTIPNLLTFARIMMVPIFVVLWFSPHHLAHPLAAITFIVAALTDWADGFLARQVISWAMLFSIF